jgi:hypothetical protein
VDVPNDQLKEQSAFTELRKRAKQRTREVNIVMADNRGVRSVWDVCMDAQRRSREISLQPFMGR